MDTNDTIGIKTATDDFNAKIVKVMRSHSDLSMGDIRNRVVNNEYLYECDYCDLKGIRKILKIQKDLKKEGIATVLYEQGDETTEVFLKNLVGSYKQTEKQVEAEMDLEAKLKN